MKLLLLINSPPAPGYSLRDSLDAALTSAVFGQQVSLLFMGGGVAHLQAGADNGLDELASYGINALYAQQQALEASQPGVSTLSPCPLDDPQIAALLASQDCVLHF